MRRVMANEYLDVSPTEVKAVSILFWVDIILFLILAIGSFLVYIG